MRTCATLQRTSWARGCRDFPTIPTDAARDPSSRQRGHREGADKEGTLAAMKALWRELADPKIKDHHGPVVKTHGWLGSRAGKAGCRLVSPRKRSGPSGPGAGTCFNRVTPGFWEQRPPTYCGADGQVMIESGQVLAGLAETRFYCLLPCFNCPAPEGG